MSDNTGCCARIVLNQ